MRHSLTASGLVKRQEPVIHCRMKHSGKKPAGALISVRTLGEKFLKGIALTWVILLSHLWMPFQPRARMVAMILWVMFGNGRAASGEKKVLPQIANTGIPGKMISEMILTQARR